MEPREVMRYKKLLVRHEGFSEMPYKDSVGKLTIGIGRNLDDKGISSDEAMYMLGNDINTCLEDLRQIFDMGSIDDVRSAALLDMRFNLGAAGFRTFSNMLAAVHKGDWQQAAHEALKSKWAQQLPNRSEEVAHMLKSGEDL